MIAGQTLELRYDEVPGINESEIEGLEFFSVTPHTAETLRVRVVAPLT